MTTATQLPLEGFAPGIHLDLPAEQYHSDRTSLSSTGARRILMASPATFRYELDNPPAPKKAFDLGTAVHKLVLGDGPKLTVVPGARWDTKDAKARLRDVRAEGAVPLKEHEHAQVQAMADAVRRHPMAARLLNPESGKPEQSLFWTDPITGVQCRARLDWLPYSDGGQLVVPDLKTAISASPKAFNKAVQEFRYDQQAHQYTDGVEALGLAEEAAMAFVIVEKTPPYLVNVIELSSGWLLMGADRNKRAREIYDECMRTGVWPGYGQGVVMVDPPSWLETEHEREMTSAAHTLNASEGPSHV